MLVPTYVTCAPRVVAAKQGRTWTVEDVKMRDLIETHLENVSLGNMNVAEAVA